MKPLNRKNYGSIPHLSNSKLGEKGKLIFLRNGSDKILNLGNIALELKLKTIVYTLLCFYFCHVFSYIIINKKNKMDKEKGLKNLQKALFTDISYEEIEEFEHQANLVFAGIKLTAHFTAKDKPKFKSHKYVELAEKYKLKILITDFPDIESVKNGWKNIYIFRNEIMRQIIIDAEKIDSNSNLYHFVLGKIFSYSDKDVVNFIANFS